MLGVTLFGLFLTPVFFVTVESVSGPPRAVPADTPPPPPAQEPHGA
jgi:hypothetical protein